VFTRLGRPQREGRREGERERGRGGREREREGGREGGNITEYVQYTPCVVSYTIHCVIYGKALYQN